MYAFRIESVAHGWFEARLGKHYLICSDYLSADTPQLFLRALLRLMEGDGQAEWLCWPDEPGAVIMRLSREDERLCAELFHGTRGSYFLPDSGPALEDACGERWGVFQEKAAVLLESVATAFSLYEDGNGREMYQQHWMPFPQAEYDRLKRLTRRLFGDEKPFFDTY